jgi:hypothetical protein
MMKNILYLLIFLFAITSKSPAQSRAADNPNFSADLHKVSPRQLLDILNFNSGKAKGAKFVTVSFDPPKNWVGKEDLGYLMKLIRSQDKCRCVIHVFSSYLPFQDSSTIGGQAMNMIDSYRTGKPYFEGSWNCAKTDSARLREIELWWKRSNSKSNSK